MRINGKEIKRIVTVLGSGEVVTVIGYIFATYINRENGEIVFRHKHLPGEKLTLYKNYYYIDPYYKNHEYYINYTDSNNNPLSDITQVPEEDTTYYLDVVKVIEQNAPLEIEYDGTNQYPLSCIKILSNRELYFLINDVGGYSFHLLYDYYVREGIHNYSVGFEVYGLSSNPGQTYHISPTLHMYLDSSHTKHLGYCNIDIIIYDKTQGNED